MLFFSFILSRAAAIDSNSSYQWLMSYPQSSQSKEVLERYSGLSTSFSTNLFQWTQKQLAKSTSAALKMYNQNHCTESTLFKIVDGKKIFGDITKKEQVFSDSLILIETAYCLPNIRLQEAYSVYMSNEFRSSVMPQVLSFEKKGNLYCTEGEGIFGIIKPSSYCYRVIEKRDNNTIIIRNSIQTVKHGEEWQPFYFREEALMFVQMENSVALYRATLTRSDDLSTTAKYLLRSTVDSSQSSIREEYFEWLQK